MKLYQIGSIAGQKDSVFLNCSTLLEFIQSQNSVWIVAERKGELLAVFSMLIDRENRLAKINRLYIDPGWDDWERLLREGLPLLVRYLKDQKRNIEVLYVTTRTFTLEQQEVILKMGFKILGVFPVSPVHEQSSVNGLTALFFEDVLSERRYQDFSLHPIVKPFYELARKECGLPDLEVSTHTKFGAMEYSPLPPLELIYAPQFVSRRYQKLEERKSLAIHFYPFSKPNTLITDADGKVEIYVKAMKDSHMATIIAERMDFSVNPTELYKKVSLMLAKENINYVEVINDAADTWGIECITEAGFLPCAYFPCLKNQGEGRRDYVILARSFERFFLDKKDISQANPKYLDFWREYYKLEVRDYLNT